MPKQDNKYSLNNMNALDRDFDQKRFSGEYNFLDNHG